MNYGASIYEGIRFYESTNGPAIFRLDDHLDRFFYSASVLKMDLGYSQSELKEAICKLIRANNLTSGYIRPLAFYSEPKMGINILGSKITVMICVWPWAQTERVRTARLWVSKYKRTTSDTIDFRAKVGGYYANNLLGFLEARENGYDEPLFLDHQNYIAEGAVNNIFIVLEGKLITPLTRNILGGITRDTILRLAKDSGIPVEELDISLYQLKHADDVFLTGTGIELEHVEEVSGYYKRKNKEHGVAERLSRMYREVATGENPAYLNWLTLVKSV